MEGGPTPVLPTSDGDRGAIEGFGRGPSSTGQGVPGPDGVEVSSSAAGRTRGTTGTTRATGAVRPTSCRRTVTTEGPTTSGVRPSGALRRTSRTCSASTPGVTVCHRTSGGRRLSISTTRGRPVPPNPVPFLHHSPRPTVLPDRGEVRPGGVSSGGRPRANRAGPTRGAACRTGPSPRASSAPTRRPTARPRTLSCT